MFYEAKKLNKDQLLLLTIISQKILNTIKQKKAKLTATQGSLKFKLTATQGSLK